MRNWAIAGLLLLSRCAHYDAPGNYLFLLAALNNSSSSSTSTPYPRIFITSGTYDGNLGGAAGADAKCQADAAYPGTGTYKAMLVDNVARAACTTSNCGGGSAENSNWVFVSGRTYYRKTDSAVIFMPNSSNIFLFGTLTNSFGTTAGYFWSGMRVDWTNSGSDCTNWTTNSNAVNGRLGNLLGTDNTAIRDNAAPAISCDLFRALVCVEQ